MKPITHPIEFRLFLIVWNKAQGMMTPGVHLKIAEWLQTRWTSGDRRLLLMAFRSCGKSTITGVFAAWLLYANPDLRILVLAAEGTLASRMVRNVRRMIEKHPLTAHLVPAAADQWAGDRFTINRRLELRDPSMMARGIDANITGSRADVIICDDVEVPKTSDTAEKREGLREILDELNFILTPGGTILYIGTPHSWYTIYADEARTEIGETQSYLHHYKRMKVAILDDEGRSAWPERYSVEDIEQLKIQAGPNKFTSQMMLQPVNVLEGRLNPALLKRYSGELDYTRQLDLLQIDGRKMIACSAFWDPAMSGRDGSVIAIIFIDEQGDLWLHRVCYLRKGSNVDQGEMQVRQAAKILKDNYVPMIAVESNGVGNLLPQMLRRELNNQNIPCTVVSHTASENKGKRIMESFDTVMAAGMLHVHDMVYGSSLIREMQEWMPKQKNARDDGLDAVASAIALRPPQLKAGPSIARLTWQGGSRTQQADTDFKV